MFPTILRSGVKTEVCGSLIAQETVFGWILTDPLQLDTTPAITTIMSNFCALEKQISRFWEVEDLPRKKFLTPSDQSCEDLYIRTTRRNSEGRYMVSLPFIDEYPDDITIGHSRTVAMAQYFKNEARLLRSSELKLEYDKVIEEYLILNHMTEISPPLSTDPIDYYYMPHHAVIKPESTTTKVRVVFNASAKTSNGQSLNDLLHVGPTLQNDLSTLILKWRLFKYVFNGDITKMYRQILVNSEHSKFQRIVFRQNPNDSIHDYELRTVTFGVNCAPYLAIRTLQQLADDVQSIYPLASDILQNSLYVDDAMVGTHTIASAIEARTQLVKALKSGGFDMRKWTSNSKAVIADIPTEDLLHEDFLEFDDCSTAKF